MNNDGSRRLSSRALFAIALAIFSMHFGAASMLWPTTWGRDSGSAFPIAFSGFFISGIILPWLGYFAASKNQGSFFRLTEKVGSKFCLIVGGITVIFLGPVFGVPRMSAATWDAFQKLVPDGAIKGTWGESLVFNFVFYLITLWFVYREEKIIDKMSKFLVPALIVIEAVIIAKTLILPLGDQAPPNYSQPPFIYGFVNGYQTVDLVCALMFSGIIVRTLRQRLNGAALVNYYLVITGMIGFLVMALIQFGEMYRGSTVSLIYPDVSYAELSATITMTQFGYASAIIFNSCLMLACLTSAIGVLAGASEFMVSISKGKISFTKTCLVVLFFSMLVGSTGLKHIMTWATPLLQFIYPPLIALTICSVFLDKYPGGLKGACIATAVWGALDALNMYLVIFGMEGGIPFINDIPGQAYGMSFCWFMVAGWMAGNIIWRRSTEKIGMDFTKSDVSGKLDDLV